MVKLLRANRRKSPQTLTSQNPTTIPQAMMTMRMFPDFEGCDYLNRFLGFGIAELPTPTKLWSSITKSI